jgi:hypothetical protein
MTKSFEVLNCNFDSCFLFLTALKPEKAFPKNNVCICIIERRVSRVAYSFSLQGLEMLSEQKI